MKATISATVRDLPTRMDGGLRRYPSGRSVRERGITLKRGKPAETFPAPPSPNDPLRAEEKPRERLERLAGLLGCALALKAHKKEGR